MKRLRFDRTDFLLTSPMIAAVALGVPLASVVVLGAWLLLRLVRRIELDQPFVAASAQTLRLLSMIVLVGSLAVTLCTGIADSVVTQRALHDVVSFGFAVPFVAVVAAFLTLALAEAFAQCVGLQDDVEGLV